MSLDVRVIALRVRLRSVSHIFSLSLITSLLVVLLVLTDFVASLLFLFNSFFVFLFRLYFSYDRKSCDGKRFLVSLSCRLVAAG